MKQKLRKTKLKLKTKMQNDKKSENLMQNYNSCTN